MTKICLLFAAFAMTLAACDKSAASKTTGSLAPLPAKSAKAKVVGKEQQQPEMNNGDE